MGRVYSESLGQVRSGQVYYSADSCAHSKGLPVSDRDEHCGTWPAARGQVRSGQVRSGQVRSGQVRSESGQVRSRSGQVCYSAKICDLESHKEAWATSRVSTGLNLATLEYIDVIHRQHSLPNDVLCHDTRPVTRKACPKTGRCNFGRMRVRPLPPKPSVPWAIHFQCCTISSLRRRSLPT